MLSAAVVPKADCSSAHVLCLCGGLGSSLLLCSFPSFHHFSPAVVYALLVFSSPSSTLRVGLRVSSALVLLLTLLTLIQSSWYRHTSSVVFLRLRAVFANLALPLFFLKSPLDLLVVVLSLLCLNSLAAHRDLSHLCAARRLLRAARLQRHLVAVHDSVVRFWPPPTPPLSIAPLRDRWFAVGALAPLLFSLTLTWLRASWSAGTTRLRHVRIDRPVFMCERLVFRRSAILPWIFAVGKWMRGQQVWSRRGRRM